MNSAAGRKTITAFTAEMARMAHDLVVHEVPIGSAPAHVDAPPAAHLCLLLHLAVVTFG